MPGSQILNFGPYRLDTQKEQFWHETQPVRLTPKAFQVLCYVGERPGQLVTKEELFRVLWADTVVSDAALTTCIQEIRKALQDNSRSPQYLETVHRRGFRFIAAVEEYSPDIPVAFRQAQGDRENEQTTEPQPFVLSPSTGSGQALSKHEQTPDEGKAEWNPTPMDLLEPVLSEAEGSDHNVVPHPSSVNENPSPTLPAQRSWSVRSLVFVGLVLLVGVILTVQYLSRPPLSPQSSALGPQAPQAPPLPDKPSIIVLPFVNLSGDAEQEYFSDGLTEVLTGDLSKISSLFVIARNSAFIYKGKAAKVQDVSKEMGVRYVLEGSVQKADQRVRIAVQLIDATTGYHLWSEQYDRPLKDIFALQDEIVQKIVTTLKLQLTLQEHGYIVRKHTDNLEAYDSLLRGIEPFFRYTQEANAQARQLWEKAVALDPQYAEAYEWLSVTYFAEWNWRWSADPQTLEHALALAQKGAALDDSLPVVHWGLSHVYVAKQQYDQAIAEGERAIALDPNNAESYAVLAEALNFAGKPEEALRAVAQAMRLNPRYPPWYLSELGWAYQLNGRYAEAIATLKEVISRNPNFLSAHFLLATSYLGQLASQQNPDPQTLAQALAAAQRGLALNDSSPWGHQLLGYVYLHQKEYDQAIAEMERAIALDPNNADSYVGQARVYLGTGRYAEAITTLQEAVSRNPNHLGVHFLLATSYLAQWVSQLSPDAQTLAQALAAAQRGLALNDSSPWGHGLLGTVYLLQKQYEPAIAEMERVIALAPNDAGGYAGLAEMLSRVGRSEEAVGMVEQALRRNPSGDASRSIGTAYSLAGRPEEAIAPLKRFLDRNPNFLPVHLMLAAVYSELGQAAEAQAEAAEVLRINPQLSLEVVKEMAPIKDPAILERIAAALRKAGLK